jgi:hypothetical protein
MPHIEEIDTSEENKENVPPGYPHPFNLDNLVEHFDKKFKNFEDYRTYVQTHLLEWAYDTDFRLFDAAYCQYRLNKNQEERLPTFLDAVHLMKQSTSEMIYTQLVNIDRLIPKLRLKGLQAKMRDVEKPRSKKRKEPETCPSCRLPYVYDHIAWCRGLSDGYTCRCSKAPAKNSTRHSQTSDLHSPSTIRFLQK